MSRQLRPGAPMAAKKNGTGADVPDPLPVSANDRGEFPIRIARDGTWYHEGAPIRRKPLVRLLATALHRDSTGRYWLATPFERGAIQVDDAPFTAVELAVDGKGRDATVRFRTNLDEWVAAGIDHPIRVEHHPESGEPSPYVSVRSGLPALIARPVFYQLVDIAEAVETGGQTVLRIWSRGTGFDLGAIA